MFNASVPEIYRQMGEKLSLDTSVFETYPPYLPNPGRKWTPLWFNHSRRSPLLCAQEMDAFFLRSIGTAIVLTTQQSGRWSVFVLASHKRFAQRARLTWECLRWRWEWHKYVNQGYNITWEYFANREADIDKPTLPGVLTEFASTLQVDPLGGIERYVKRQIIVAYKDVVKNATSQRG